MICKKLTGWASAETIIKLQKDRGSIVHNIINCKGLIYHLKTYQVHIEANFE